jgi:high affinity Mn2+ porin
MRFSLNQCALFTLLGLCFFATQAKASDSEQEDTTSKYQLTYNWQRHPSFNSAQADGPNSLSASSNTMYTFSATAHWGMRPWQGGELYFNPEVVAGVPFTGALVGLGSFTNGEITRAAGSNPTFYRQRLFLRQTWGRGGGEEKIESDFNQLAGTVDKNRFVLTVGNFSTLDVFDDNAYAKDPRTQFMNWGNWTYASYDYAADARGYGWGFAAEWYQDNWALRFGRMSAPVTPNAQAIDLALAQHFGDQLEIERSHLLAQQPGKVRLLLWHDRAIVASFNDATQYLNQPGNLPQTGPDALIKVRSGNKDKTGVGVNVEQALSPDLGFFLRAMTTDGHTETLAFTEADGSLSTGFLIKGSSWGRGQDTVGVAYMHDTISADRINFLKSGGVSFFIGDGSLNYAPEKVLESFYSYSIRPDTWLTLDYQYIQNPAYNASRGPVNVYAVRFHVEY